MTPNDSSNPARVMDEIVDHGFPSERGRLIHAMVGGSQLHGVKLYGTDDRDLYGIYIERPEYCFWHKFEHFVASTAPDSVRNQAGDVDVICYSLRKFARRAAAGNPTILHMLFTPGKSNEGDWAAVTRSRALFLAKSHALKYKGYADAQLRRMIGDRGRGKHGQRPDLETSFGYDVKAAMHVLRLLHEGIELISQGWVTLPRPEAERTRLLEVRRGEWSQDRVITEGNRLSVQLDAAVGRSSLPENADTAAIGKLITWIYLGAWKRWGWSG